MSLEGREVLDFYFAVLRGETTETIVGKDGLEHEVSPSLSLRLQAADRILDRGFGKAPLVIVHEDNSELPEQTLSLEELRQGIRLMEQSLSAIPIDVDSQDVS